MSLLNCIKEIVNRNNEIELSIEDKWEMNLFAIYEEDEDPRLEVIKSKVLRAELLKIANLR